MKKTISILILAFLIACQPKHKEHQKLFPVIDVSNDDEWTTYEGRWQAQNGVIHLELSLKTGAVGYQSPYRLYENFVERKRASGTVSENVYSTYSGMPNNGFGICLHDLRPFQFGVFLRYRKSADLHEEMFFITRGNDELIPCDDQFKPLTTDKRFTLHKRSKLFTVEGYLTVEGDSAIFYERNTMEHWNVAKLGEFDSLVNAYRTLAKEKFEGIYLKGLAYSVVDTAVAKNRDALVLKRIEDIGNDPDPN
jgi:hypothetical protein